jgi:hypothetical protein
MMSKVCKSVFLSFIFLILLFILGAGYLFLTALPSTPKASEVYVLAVPPVSNTNSFGQYQPYAGEHPRRMQRPHENFKFPIRQGEIGPVKALFGGEIQYPFFCGRDNSRDWVNNNQVQPVPDNQDGIGIPIFAVKNGERITSSIVGYSKDCLFPAHARYYYKRIGDDGFYPLEEADNDIEQLTINGRSTDFVVRLETGTINRFIYAVAVLRGEGESLEQPTGTYWNKKLVYQLNGGVGVGRRQGNFSTRDILRDRYEQIRAGYAVVYSTANQTSNHYNIWLAEDTALRVKRQFIALYGEPIYTVGTGGSGGAIQQYLFAQNSPGLLDAAIPLYSYPDMITQTTHVLDCELLEHYFDVTDAENPDWQIWEKRSWIQGLAADSSADNRFSPLQLGVDILNGNFMQGLRTNLRGSSECVSGWRGLSPLIYNPLFTDKSVDFAPSVAQSVQWSHWDDLRQFYGLDEYGFANTTWDNIGVQYGLDALMQGQISAQAFIELNARVGSWKPPHQMQHEQFWFLNGSIYPARLSLRSEQNMHLTPAPGKRAAPRYSGSLAAMQAAYLSGHVFAGVAEIPMIDVRHYLDSELDMHHSSASLSARARMIRTQGHADNQLIWVTALPHDPQVEAFALIDSWMLNIRARPEAGVVANKPGHAQDQCFNAEGNILSSGDTVWNGGWNNLQPGACMQIYPAFRTSREVAGGGPEADIFKCHRRTIADAFAAGVYNGTNLDIYSAELEQVFPDGVCDYSLGDAALPEKFLELMRD